MVIRLRKRLKVYYAKALKIIQGPSAGKKIVFNAEALIGEDHSRVSQMQPLTIKPFIWWFQNRDKDSVF